ncbi:MAG TPA: nucleotidyltransferase family protein [Patescibacteria group bacterium]|nr:nucleotidyltransferase family protein [Patescibacteria group bacterium]
MNRAELGWALAVDAAESVPSDVADAESWLAAAREERVAPMLALRWRPLVQDPAVREILSQALRAAAMQDLMFVAAEQSVVRALNDAGLPFLVLKGSALARWLYPQSMLRPRSDIDILLRDHSDLRACRQALESIGFLGSDVVAPQPQFEEAFRGRVGDAGMEVDIHWRITNHVAFADTLHFNELMAASLPLADLNAHGLGPIHALLHACIHRMSNIQTGAEDHLLWLLDIDLLSRRMTDTDWPQIQSLAVERGLAGACASALRATAHLLQTPVSESVLTSLDQAAVDEPFDMTRAASPAYYAWWSFKLVPWSQRPGYLWQKLFPNLEYMRTQFPDARRVTLPIYHLARWLKVAKRFGTRR